MADSSLRRPAAQVAGLDDQHVTVSQTRAAYQALSVTLAISPD
jgi:hypothetical protein